MRIRRYQGTDEAALLRRIREDLGPDAVVLHTAFVKNGGVFGLFARRRVEIVAGAGFRVVKDYPGEARREGAAPPTDLVKQVAEIRRLVADTQALVARKSGGIDGPPEMAEEFAQLATTRVSEALARKMAEALRARLPGEQLRDRARVKAAVRELVRENLRCVDGISLKPGRCTKVAFIGPTGVGKTTTIAKLVSIYHHHGREVAVITNDTYRIAATEQIRRVAQLVGVPIRVCSRPEEVEKALAEFSDRDLVLVDTAGRSQKHAKRMEELKDVLAAVKPDETHLVVSMTTQAETVVDVAERFAPAGFDRLVVTKLDEALKLGVVLDVLSRVPTELSFVTTGQEIPRDIEVADAARLTSLILGEETL